MRNLFLVILGFVSAAAFGDYPLINYTIESRDPLYSQQQQDVEIWYAGRGDPPPLTIYRYIPRPSEDLFSVAAAFNLPYDSLATLNGWEAPGLLSEGKNVLVPNIPGLFIPASPIGNWEKQLAESDRSTEPVNIKVSLKSEISRNFLFFPGDKFTSEERINFLGSLFSSPLADGKITSPYGYRPNPFTGGMSFHPGVDLRASTGTPVLAARDGTVGDTGTLEIYGLFVIINHDGGYQSVYAHLDEILVSEGQVVDAGSRIALSGNSGISTGPHLHFEIRRNGKPADPSRLTSFYD